MVMRERRSSPRVLDVVAALLVAIVFATRTALPSANPAEATGRVQGRVTFQGTPPAQTPVGETGDSQPRLYVDTSGGVGYAVVYLPDARTTSAPNAASVVINQRNFVFEPQVVAVRAGRTVRFTNDDVANHNVRAKGETPENTFFISTAPGSTGSAQHAFGVTRADRPVPLSCDIHPWMSAWVYVFDHDAFAVTAADGRFDIGGIRPGHYRVAVRQPSAELARDLAIDVQAGAVTHLDVRFTDADLGLAAR
jgi:plastocyanin